MLKVKILFEDKYLIIADKPAGLLAYPLEGSTEETIGDILSALPCHRLDRDTSGVMVLAKTKAAKDAIQSLFAKREVEKQYVTLVWGKVEPEKGEIKIPLARGAKDRLKVVPSAVGRTSHTIYEVIKYFPKNNMSHVRVGLKTGRTHQIRVHFSAIGHPVVGDKKYSKRATELPRQFLHASEISFVHPYDQKLISVKAGLPEDLKNYLEAFK